MDYPNKSGNDGKEGLDCFAYARNDSKLALGLLMASIEDILNLEEYKVLGYFETIKGVYLTKLLFILSHINNVNADTKLAFNSFSPWAISELASLKTLLSEGTFLEIFIAALKEENKELLFNLQDELGTSCVISGWAVFEQVLKDLIQPNYVYNTDLTTLNYENKIFQLSKREKKDISLFQYIRNALLHYNGAYYANKEIDHTYRGRRFDSKNHIGEKIEITIQLSWQILIDLEKYTYKSWINSKKLKQHLP